MVEEHENASKHETEWESRRKHWFKQKERSKSSDLSWNSGMWSPVEEKNKVLIIVTSSKKHNPQEDRSKMKLPAFFQMDSGSSYESTEQHESNKICNDHTETLNQASIHHHNTNNLACPQHQQPLHFSQQLLDVYDGKHQRRDQLSPSSKNFTENSTSNIASPKRYYDLSVCRDNAASSIHKARMNRDLWIMQNMKSHSLDSSFDDHNNINNSKTKISTASSGTSLNQAVFSSNYSNAQMQLSVTDRRRRFLQQQADKSFERKDILPTSSSPGHLFYAYNQMTKHLDRRPLRPTDVLSRETSERLRISNEEIKNMRLKEKSPEGSFKYTRTMLSPRARNAVITDDKRSTFSQQKSFSYDVPSMQPKTDLQCRKQSEPIVGNTSNMFFSRNRLMPDSAERLNHGFNSQINQSFNLQSTVYNENMQGFYQHSPNNLLHPQQPPVEINITYMHNNHQEEIINNATYSAKRQMYCSQRSQSCETGKRATVDTSRPSVSEQVLTNSGLTRRDYLSEREMKEFEIQFNNSIRPISKEYFQTHSTSNLIENRRNFSYQKSQSCEINEPSYVLSNNFVKPSPRELKNLLGYPRLLRQLAKSEMEVEPIYEKDSSNSSKDASDPPKADQKEHSNSNSKLKNQENLKCIHLKKDKSSIKHPQASNTSERERRTIKKEAKNGSFCEEDTDDGNSNKHTKTQTNTLKTSFKNEFCNKQKDNRLHMSTDVPKERHFSRK